MTSNGNCITEHDKMALCATPLVHWYSWYRGAVVRVGGQLAEGAEQ